MMCEMVSRSLRISARFLVPSTLRRVVAASRRVEWLQGRRKGREENFKHVLETKLGTQHNSDIGRKVYHI